MMVSMARVPKCQGGWDRFADGRGTNGHVQTGAPEEAGTLRVLYSWQEQDAETACAGRGFSDTGVLNRPLSVI